MTDLTGTSLRRVTSDVISEGRAYETSEYKAKLSIALHLGGSDIMMHFRKYMIRFLTIIGKFQLHRMKWNWPHPFLNIRQCYKQYCSV